MFVVLLVSIIICALIGLYYLVTYKSRRKSTNQLMKENVNSLKGVGKTIDGEEKRLVSEKDKLVKKRDDYEFAVKEIAKEANNLVKKSKSSDK